MSKELINQYKRETRGYFFTQYLQMQWGLNQEVNDQPGHISTLVNIS